MNNSSVRIDDLPTCSRIVSTSLASTISLVSVASFLGNSLVTIAFLMNTTLRTSTNYFMVNMAISDLLSSLTNWPLSATEGFLSRNVMIGGSVSTYVCKLGHYSRAVSQAVSVLSLLLVVVDRYVAIALPFQSILVTRRNRAVALLLTWIFSLSIAFPYFWSSKIIQEDHKILCRTFASWNTTELSMFYTAGFLIFYCVPLISIIILYTRIMKSLRETRPGQEEQKNTRILRNQLQNRIVMKVSMWIISAFFICWTPLCVYIILKRIFPASAFAKDSCMVIVGLFFYVFPTVSTVINPLILFKYSSRFSNALKEMFSCFNRNPSQCCKGGRVTPQHVVVEMRAI